MYESAPIVVAPGTSGPWITRAELEQSAQLFGSDYRFEGEAPQAHQAVLQGQFNSVCLRPGLMLHAAQVRDLHDLRTRNMLHHPGIKIVLVVDGVTDVAFDQRRFQLGPHSPVRDARDQGMLINLTEPACFCRHWQQGRHERKISLTLTPDWLAQGGLAHAAALARFASQHLNSRPWRIAPRARLLAQHILASKACSPPGLHRLQLESQCLELAALALGALEHDSTPSRAGARSSDVRRLARLEELLHQDSPVPLSMADIARAVGSNPTSLQALARRAWGMSVFERLRTIRLEKARALLLRGGAVAQAAELAGYSAASNFATAFRQHYGVSPSRVRG